VQPERNQKLVQDPEKVLEGPAEGGSDERKDPIQQLYAALAREAQREYLDRPYDATTWRYLTRPPLRFRASEAGNCPRRIYYRLMGCVPAPDSPRLKLLQLEGNLAQDVIRSLFEKHGIPIKGVVHMPDGTQRETKEGKRTFLVVMPDGGERSIDVSARADGFFENGHGPVVFEMKTMGSRMVYWFQQARDGYWGTKGNDAVLARIKKKYQYYDAQMQLTMAIFDIDQTCFVFKDRDSTDYGLKAPDGERASVHVPSDPAATKAILQRLASVKDAVLAEKPPQGYLDGSIECKMCPVYYQCWGAVKLGKVVYPE
jgi:CRISPR/Cas system-associated exonuclease Cas4 (RecB family)